MHYYLTFRPTNGAQNTCVLALKVGEPPFLTATLLRPYYIAKRTREILISNIHLLSPQKWSQFVHFDTEKVFPRGQP